MKSLDRNICVELSICSSPPNKVSILKVTDDSFRLEEKTPKQYYILSLEFASMTYQRILAIISWIELCL